MNVDSVDDTLLKLARSVRKHYSLPLFVVEDLRQEGWVTYLKHANDEKVFAKCYWAMRHSGDVERNGYRAGGKGGQRYVTDMDLARFPSGESLEAKAGTRHELEKIVSLCAARHRSYRETLLSFTVKMSYTLSLNMRRARLRRFLKSEGLAA